MKFLSLLFRDKKYYPFLICIVALLIMQAYCELELPNYTSRIVDVGIMQGGVENAAPTEIRETSMLGLERFMAQDERDRVRAAYEAAPGGEGRLALKDSVKNDAEARAQLSKDMMTPMLIMGQADQAMGARAAGGGAGMASGAESAIKPDEKLLGLIQSVLMGQGTEQDVKDIHSSIDAQMEALGLGSAMIESAAVEYVRGEYEAMGLDTQAIQLDYMKRMALVMVAFTLVACAGTVVVSLLASLMSAGVGRRLRRESFTQIMEFSNAEMDRFSPASLITRNTNDIQQIQMAMVFFLRLVLFAPAMAVGGIIMVTRTDTGLSWVIVAAILILAAVIGILLGLTMPKFQKMQGLIDNVNLVSREILTGLPVIRAFNREDFEKKRFDGASQTLFKNQLFTNRAMSMFMPIVFFIMNIIMVGVVWFGGKGIDDGSMQVGDLMAFMSYTMFIVMAFMMFSMVTIMLPRASVAAARVLEVIHTKSSVTDKPAGELKHEDEEFAGLVTFDDVGFRFHDADEDILSHISFTAEPGKTTAVIGGTGSGKSTMVNLIPRLFDVTRGKVTIDGVDVRDLSQRKLRSLIGVVPQKGVLFAGTIASNIKYSGSDIPDGDMRKAAEIAQAAGFIAEKEGVYESGVSQGGTNVSGGQRQRLAIARAVAKHPKVFVFDDSFSALDYKTDANLRHALAKNLGGATILIVAQRIATILRADKIIVLDDGRIVGEGTHKELLESCEIYREIAASQMNEEELSA
ncbi:MAG: ABC transporter ATP-binding protein/permease [Clostridiales Family XIII bacterium]|jgi:ATP-binding cassette subfamily B protein|nr:ABC transporter ATP-binding protein/permease [Clostridiales Family XIII bacterium]